MLAPGSALVRRIQIRRQGPKSFELPDFHAGSTLFSRRLADRFRCVAYRGCEAIRGERIPDLLVLSSLLRALHLGPSARPWDQGIASPCPRLYASAHTRRTRQPIWWATKISLVIGLEGRTFGFLTIPVSIYRRNQRCADAPHEDTDLKENTIGLTQGGRIANLRTPAYATDPSFGTSY
jgi:hypothetical protein